MRKNLVLEEKHLLTSEILLSRKERKDLDLTKLLTPVLRHLRKLARIAKLGLTTLSLPSITSLKSLTGRIFSIRVFWANQL